MGMQPPKAAPNQLPTLHTSRTASNRHDAKKSLKFHKKKCVVVGLTYGWRRSWKRMFPSIPAFFSRVLCSRPTQSGPYILPVTGGGEHIGVSGCLARSFLRSSTYIFAGLPCPCLTRSIRPYCSSSLNSLVALLWPHRSVSCIFWSV